MWCYIFLILCCYQFDRVTAFPKYLSSEVKINPLQNNLVGTSYSPPELVSPRSQLLESTNFVRIPASDINPHTIELEIYQDNLNKDVPAIQMNVDESRISLADVVKEIRSHQFTQAEIMLRKIDSINKIPEIVHSVYNSSEININLLLDFGRDLTKIDLAYSVLFALWDEMKANGHLDVHKMIALVDLIELKLINLNASPEWRAKAELVIHETIMNITSASVEILKAAMISSNYRNNTQAMLVADSIFKLDSNHRVFDEVIQKVTNESFSEVSAIEIAQNLYSHAFLSQVISGLQELFRKLENANNLNNPAVLNIAEYLKQLKHMPNYVNLGHSKKKAVDTMIEKMPMCARNLFFEPFVCIWNKGKAEYLYVAGSEFNRNEDKRSVFTRTTKEAVGPGVWTVEKSGDEFFFRNKAYENEYIFAATGMHNKDSRFVHTWTEGGKVNNKSSWKIELEGDVCYLRNANYNEYLFVSDQQSGEKSRYVFTWIPKTSTKEANFQWQIRSCDLSAILKKGV